MVFYLVPLGQPATNIVSLPINAPFKHNASNGRVWLRVGLEHTPKKSGQLISFGSDRSRCDINLPEGCPMQCHFFIHPRTRELLLRDDSSNSSTILFASAEPAASRFSLPDAQPRQRVVLGAIQNARIRMHNALFTLGWGPSRCSALEAARTMPRFTPSGALSSNPVDLLEGGRIVHSRMAQLGQGSSAKVFLTLNLKTGDHLAVKIFVFRRGMESKGKEVVRKEVDMMKELSHVSYLPLGHLASLWWLICLSAKHSCL